MFDPLPALNKWFCKRDRHPKQNSKSKNQEWFAGVFKQAADNGTLQNNSDATTEDIDDSFTTHVEL